MDTHVAKRIRFQVRIRIEIYIFNHPMDLKEQNNKKKQDKTTYWWRYLTFSGKGVDICLETMETRPTIIIHETRKQKMEHLRSNYWNEEDESLSLKWYLIHLFHFMNMCEKNARQTSRDWKTLKWSNSCSRSGKGCRMKPKFRL